MKVKRWVPMTWSGFFDRCSKLLIAQWPTIDTWNAQDDEICGTFWCHCLESKNSEIAM